MERDRRQTVGRLSDNGRRLENDLLWKRRATRHEPGYQPARPENPLAPPTTKSAVDQRPFDADNASLDHCLGPGIASLLKARGTPKQGSSVGSSVGYGSGEGSSDREVNETRGAVQFGWEN
jgi:hypothetical protein